MTGATTARDPGEVADAIAAAVTACPGVAGLAAGPVATYLPGRIVAGVAVRDGALQVAVIARYGQPLAETAEQVRAAASRVAPGRRVDVAVEDIMPDGAAR